MVANQATTRAPGTVSIPVIVTRGSGPLPLAYSDRIPEVASRSELAI